MSFSSPSIRPTTAASKAPSSSASRAARVGLVAAALLGALSLSACKLTFGAAELSDSDNGGRGEDLPGGVGGSGGAVMIGGGGAPTDPSGAGGEETDSDSPPPTYEGNYAEFCGGLAAGCTPGTNDCTQGGNPAQNGAGGGTAALACQLAVASDEVVAQCAQVGPFAAGDPCESASDCGPGLGCVITAGSGTCREYCCGDLEACPSATYCAPVSMAEAPSAKIPACIKVKSCQLLDDATCTDGLTCTIVREDGTTSCVEPGTGLRGDACPCAPGFVCSKVTNTCVKLCHIGSDGPDCGDGTCQGGVMGYPDGIGICVGYP